MLHVSKSTSKHNVGGTNLEQRSRNGMIVGSSASCKSEYNYNIFSRLIDFTIL